MGALLRHRTGLGWTLLWTALAFVYLFPYTWMVLTAFRRPVDTFARPLRVLFRPSLDGFAHLFQIVGFQKYLLNSVVVTSLSVLLTIALAVPAAYAIAQLERRASTFLALILVARMIPGIAIAVPAYVIATSLRQLDTYQILVVVNIGFNLPFAIWLLRSFFLDVHPGLREAASIDGASEWQVLRVIMIPLTLGGILATAVFVFIGSWNEFLFALVLTTSRSATAPLAILGFRTAHGVQWDAISAAAVLISAPVIVFAFAMQRHLVQGLTMGSIK